MIDTQVDYSVALALAARTYPPYSKFAVGAAFKCRSETVVVGADIENRSFGLTICTERVAIGAAVAAGERDFVAIAVTADSDEPIVPCGGCRQFLAESNWNLIIVSETIRGHRKIENLLHLLPEPTRGILKHAEPS